MFLKSELNSGPPPHPTLTSPKCLPKGVCYIQWRISPCKGFQLLRHPHSPPSSGPHPVQPSPHQPGPSGGGNPGTNCSHILSWPGRHTTISQHPTIHTRTRTPSPDGACTAPGSPFAFLPQFFLPPSPTSTQPATLSLWPHLPGTLQISVVCLHPPHPFLKRRLII